MTTRITASQVKTTTIELGKRQKTFNVDVQAHAIDIVEHIFVHKNVGLADDLIKALKGADRKGLIAWFKEYGCLKPVENAPSKLNKKMHLETEFDREYLETQATKWYDMGDSVDEIIKALDVAQRLQSIANSILKAKDEGRQINADQEAILTSITNIRLALMPAPAGVPAAEQITAELKNREQEDRELVAEDAAAKRSESAKRAAATRKANKAAKEAAAA